MRYMIEQTQFSPPNRGKSNQQVATRMTALCLLYIYNTLKHCLKAL